MNEINRIDVKACRLCLETNCRLFDINKNKLVHVLDEFTSSSASEMIGIPPYVCSFCCTLLKKATTFRNQCMETQNYLHECSLIEPLTLDIIQKTDRAQIKNMLTTSNITITYCIDGEALTESIKEFHDDIKTERNSELNVDSEFSDAIVEFNDSYNDNFTLDFIKLEDNLKTELPKVDIITVPTKKKKTSKRKERDCKSKKKKNKISKEILFNALQQQIADSTYIHTKLFYSYILDKYVKSTKPIVNKELIDPFDSDEEFLVKKCDYGKMPSVDDIKKMDVDKKVFYEYVNEKYKQGNLQEKKVVNVTRLHSKMALRKKKPNRSCRQMEEFGRFGQEFNFEVISLTKKEQIAEVLARKNNSNYINSPYKCEICFRGFRGEKTYRSHVIAHDPNTGSEVCEICQSRFSSRRKMTTHAQKHKWKFICKTCSAVFKCSTEARNHYASHGGKKFICEHCGKIFTRYRSRLDHIRIHHGASRCDICYKGMSNSNAVNSHKSKAHREVFICDVCNVIFNKKAALNRHISTLVTTCSLDVRPCSACGENLQNEQELEDHISTAHPYIRPDFTPGRKMGSRNKKRCCPCGHKTDYTQNQTQKPDYPTPSDPSSLKIDIQSEFTLPGQGIYTKLESQENYQKIVMESESYPKLIPDTFQSKPLPNQDGFVKLSLTDYPKLDPISESYPKIGEDIQNPTNQYNCNCPCKLVVRRRKRRRRIEIDGDLKKMSDDDEDVPKKQKYMCEVCAKDNFQTITSLREHQLIHTGEKPHQCQVCWKRFRLRCLLQMHMTVHTGERAYKCDSCDKTFKTPPARNRHLLVHTGERRHQCSMCDKRFQTTSCLKTHVKSVHMKIPYPPSRANARR